VVGKLTRAIRVGTRIQTTGHFGLEKHVAWGVGKRIVLCERHTQHRVDSTTVEGVPLYNNDRSSESGFRPGWLG